MTPDPCRQPRRTELFFKKHPHTHPGMTAEIRHAASHSVLAGGILTIPRQHGLPRFLLNKAIAIDWEMFKYTSDPYYLNTMVEFFKGVFPFGLDIDFAIPKKLEAKYNNLVKDGDVAVRCIIAWLVHVSTQCVRAAYDGDLPTSSLQSAPGFGLRGPLPENISHTALEAFSSKFDVFCTATSPGVRDYRDTAKVGIHIIFPYIIVDADRAKALVHRIGLELAKPSDDQKAVLAHHYLINPDFDKDFAQHPDVVTFAPFVDDGIYERSLRLSGNVKMEACRDCTTRPNYKETRKGLEKLAKAVVAYAGQQKRSSVSKFDIFYSLAKLEKQPLAKMWRVASILQKEGVRQSDITCIQRFLDAYAIVQCAECACAGKVPCVSSLYQSYGAFDSGGEYLDGAEDVLREDLLMCVELTSLIRETCYKLTPRYTLPKLAKKQATTTPHVQGVEGVLPPAAKKHKGDMVYKTERVEDSGSVIKILNSLLSGKYLKTIRDQEDGYRNMCNAQKIEMVILNTVQNSLAKWEMYEGAMVKSIKRTHGTSEKEGTTTVFVECVLDQPHNHICCISRKIHGTSTTRFLVKRDGSIEVRCWSEKYAPCQLPATAIRGPECLRKACFPSSPDGPITFLDKMLEYNPELKEH